MIARRLSALFLRRDMGRPEYKACDPYEALYIGADQRNGQMFKGDILSVEAEADGVLFVRNKRTGGTVSNMAKCLVHVSER